ncbi:MAG: response regulator [Caldilineales bacterium]|nr:response regulator [Caldilineales bacterium]MDW8318090.1 response regulator [Anaerolineae bacterium]
MTGDAYSAFVQEVRQALQGLYDPIELRHSPLLARFGLERAPNPGLALQETLIRAIQALKPPATVPPHTAAQRLFRILQYRYVEQSPQKEVANDLALSIRQLRRLENEAIALLADSLAQRYGLAFAEEVGRAHGEDAEEAPSPVADRETEFDWLRRSLPIETADVEQLVQGVLPTAEPVLSALGVAVQLRASANLPPVACRVTPLRQALLNLVLAAGRTVPSGKVEIALASVGKQVEVTLRPVGLSAVSATNDVYRESIEIARQLVELSDGAMTVQANADAPLAVTLSLRSAAQRTVLVIDDNADALQLAARFLSGSPYVFVGSQDPEEGVALAVKTTPCAIVLDVMMPGIDGWELLGRLRTHPVTAHIPVIVATILPQEQLALALGAAAFLRKPFNRETLLATLAKLAHA